LAEALKEVYPLSRSRIFGYSSVRRDFSSMRVIIAC
jgi:hypothetical protein